MVHLMAGITKLLGIAIADADAGRIPRDRVEAKRARILHLWTHGPEHRGDQSCWEAYNAVAQSVDHDRNLWPTRGPRTASLFDGNLARVKQRTLDTLAAHANGGRGTI